MKGHFQDILLSILAAGFGAWMIIVGLGIGKPEAFRSIDWARFVAGFVVFLTGAWLFFRDTLGPGGYSLPIYHWVGYLMLVPALAILGVYFSLSGIAVRDWDSVWVGLISLGSAAWVAVKKFPGRGSRP
jgi:hypothetical protein